MHLHRLGVRLLLLCVLVALPIPVAATHYMRPESQRILTTDLVVLARVEAILDPPTEPRQRFQIAVESTLKGRSWRRHLVVVLPFGEVRQREPLAPTDPCREPPVPEGEMEMPEFFSGWVPQLLCGRSEVFFLKRLQGGSWELSFYMDAADAPRLQLRARQLPDWRRSRDGLALVLIDNELGPSDGLHARRGESVDLALGMRNFSRKPLRLRYAGDAPANAPTIELQMYDPAGRVVSVQGPQARPAAWFQRYERDQWLELAPGEAIFWPLHELLTAAPDPADEPDLQTPYFPIQQAGRYELRATARGFLDGRELRSGRVQLLID